MSGLNPTGGMSRKLPGSKRQKRPAAAALLSFLLPGLGHFYCGKSERGGTTLLFFLLGALIAAWGWAEDRLLVSGGGAVVCFAMYLFAPLDAYFTARKIPTGTKGPWEFHMEDGQSAYDRGDYREAGKQYKAALRDAESFAPDDPRWAKNLNNLGEVFRSQGKYSSAEPLFQEASSIAEKSLGKSHPDFAKVQNNLALLYEAKGKYAEAEQLLKEVLGNVEPALGAEHPVVGTSVRNLGMLYFTRGNYREAEPLLQRAAAISEKAHGPDHPDVAWNLQSLAVIFTNQGKFAEAALLFLRSQVILEKSLGPDHLQIATCLENHASLLRKMGRESEAADAETRARTIRASYSK